MIQSQMFQVIDAVYVYKSLKGDWVGVLVGTEWGSDWEI